MLGSGGSGVTIVKLGDAREGDDATGARRLDGRVTDAAA
jgi:hypothetical protein